MASAVKREAARDAAKLLQELWGRPIPVDPAFIARAAGLRVVEAPLDEDTMGALVKRPGAIRFGVSRAAMQYRLKNLGIE